MDPVCLCPIWRWDGNVPSSGRQPLALLRVGEDHFFLSYFCAYGNPYGRAKRILKDASTWSRLEEQAERILGSGLCQLFLLASVP